METIDALEQGDVLHYGQSSVALTTGLWDNRGRSRCLRRTADAARDSGSLQMLDSALWVMSIAETMGGTPRRAARYIEQVRELRRAIGFDAEHVINVSLLAWQGCPVTRWSPWPTEPALMGFGGVQSAAMVVVAIGRPGPLRLRAALRDLRPLVDEPFFHTGAPAAIPTSSRRQCAAARRGGAGHRSPTAARTGPH